MNDSHDERTPRTAESALTQPASAPDGTDALRKSMDDAVAVAENHLRRAAATQRAQFHGD